MLGSLGLPLAMPAARMLLFALAAAGSVSFLACQGCRSSGGLSDSKSGSASREDENPTVRLLIVSDLAGAIEPCGCVKDQLGGLDHLAAYVVSERARVPASAIVSAGPLFFLDPALQPDKKAQDVAKATTLAESLHEAGLAAFAPGRNDWAAGGDELEKLRVASGAAMVAGNLDGVPAAWRGTSIREIGGVKVGFCGASALAAAQFGLPQGVTAREVVPSVRAQVAALKKDGAQIIVALAATGRGEAKRLADAIPELSVVVVGSASSYGDGNTETPPPERLGNVIVAEAGNHLTTAVVLDFHVHDGSFEFADASGLERGRQKAALRRRIDDLRGKIAQWATDDSKVQKADLDARRAELQKLETEQAGLEREAPPTKGSFFRYSVVEVRDSLGSDPGVKDKLGAYYKQVNDANRVAFADRVPKAPPPGAPGFVGVDKCDACHAEAREVWNKTRHSKAYATLTTEHKEFNLDCVSCHVTGYDEPGGSTVTHVSGLENVQCENCHGPGSLHVKNPKVAMPIPSPKPTQCLSCHHPPHVHEFDAAARMADIMGPGHGR